MTDDNVKGLQELARTEAAEFDEPKIIIDTPPVKRIAVKYDPQNMSYVEWRKLATLNMFDQLPVWEKMLISWDLAEPLTTGVLSAMDIEDASEVLLTLREGLGEAQKELAKHIKVDFRGQRWSFSTIQELTELDAQGKYEKVAEMMLKVCRFAGTKQPKANSLDAVEGGAAFTAIIDKWTKVMQGKN